MREGEFLYWPICRYTNDSKQQYCPHAHKSAGAMLIYTILKYLYTVGLLIPHTLASSLTFIFPAL